METARILVRYVTKILLPTPNCLKITKWGTANSPVHITSIFSFSPDICKHGGCNCNRSVFILPASYGKVVCNYGT